MNGFDSNFDRRGLKVGLVNNDSRLLLVVTPQRNATSISDTLVKSWLVDQGVDLSSISYLILCYRIVRIIDALQPIFVFLFNHNRFLITWATKCLVHPTKFLGYYYLFIVPKILFIKPNTLVPFNKFQIFSIKKNIFLSVIYVLKAQKKRLYCKMHARWILNTFYSQYFLSIRIIFTVELCFITETNFDVCNIAAKEAKIRIALKSQDKYKFL